MIKVRIMTPEDANDLQTMMVDELPEYLAHFTAFDEPGSLFHQCVSAQQDAFFTLLYNELIAGFYCLRGLDEGYTRPSFGVYISSNSQGKGLARKALNDAYLWCQKHSVTILILKVAHQNQRARKLYEQSGFVAIENDSCSGQIIMEKRIN